MNQAVSVRNHSRRRWLAWIGISLSVVLVGLLVTLAAAVAWIVPQLIGGLGSLMVAIGSFAAVPYEMTVAELEASTVLVEWVGEPVEFAQPTESRWIERGQVDGQPVGDWEFFVEAHGPRGTARVRALCGWTGAAWNVRQLDLISSGDEIELLSVAD